MEATRSRLCMQTYTKDIAIQLEYFSENVETVVESAKAKMPEIGSNKWIVLTTINEPTADVKVVSFLMAVTWNESTLFQYLASLSGWNLVVVADLKTPKNWNLEGVHFLSVEMQLDMSLAFNFVRKLPYKSYTRKMIGYLYAISHGAEWIYDTDDDNRPIFGGLDTFDFADELSGVRFERNHEDPIINRLFNPYLHFGRPDMWPRGFPLEYFSQHNHTDANFRLCEVQKRAAVQQGLVDMDPDVDAIFRLLHANPTKVSSEHFNRHAPPIILGQKMYSPWNSQNTLFHRNAFFTMFLPTTVSFRTTDIWRSYFSQKLLHLVDEYVAFYPVNAVQIRNAHNYLKDFEDEQDVYLKSSQILNFLDNWNCDHNSTVNCAIELAEQFGKMEFWSKDDVDLFKEWVRDLTEIGITSHKALEKQQGNIAQLNNILDTMTLMYLR
ncbi:hypothetical protein WR25_14799 isoform A [Diploscapter pachys]|uniref:Uncharacterized protein n=1 Tax=Diploscapter pachys TaxID=2018661 RepID=A0A2A2JGM2_9BILA|nr:hypothetical protein WR25_14799 isoform A [Diploscapter pachys]